MISKDSRSQRSHLFNTPPPAQLTVLCHRPEGGLRQPGVVGTRLGTQCGRRQVLGDTQDHAGEDSHLPGVTEESKG